MSEFIKTNVEITENGVFLMGRDDYVVQEFSVEKDGYYALEIEYAHDDWEGYIKGETTYPDGTASTFLKGLPHGRNKISINVFFKAGTNLLKINQSFGQILLRNVINKGPTEITDYELTPENVFFSCDAPKCLKTVIKNYRKELVEIKTESGIPIPFEIHAKEPYNEYTASMIEVLLNNEVLLGLGKGEHTLCYCLENGVALKQRFTVKEVTPKTNLQFINFNVGCANATLLSLPNGKNMLVDSATDKSAREKIIPYLEKHSLKVDYYLLTHFHSDHFGCVDEILEQNGIKKPDQKQAEKMVKADKASREGYLKNYGYLDSSMLCFYDEIHNIWDLGGVKIEVLNSQFDENGKPMYIYNYPFIKNNEHNFENATSVSFMLDYNGFRYYHGADNYAFSQDRLIVDYTKQGREDELRCHYFFGNHHFICDTSAEFMNTLNPKVVFVPICGTIYSRSTYQYVYKENVKDYYFSHKRLSDTLISSETGNVRVCVNSADNWYYENIQDEDL